MCMCSKTLKGWQWYPRKPVAATEYSDRSTHEYSSSLFLHALIALRQSEAIWWGLGVTRHVAQKNWSKHNNRNIGETFNHYSCNWLRPCGWNSSPIVLLLCMLATIHVHSRQSMRFYHIRLHEGWRWTKGGIMVAQTHTPKIPCTITNTRWYCTYTCLYFIPHTIHALSSRSAVTS